MHRTGYSAEPAVASVLTSGDLALPPRRSFGTDTPFQSRRVLYDRFRLTASDLDWPGTIDLRSGQSGFSQTAPSVLRGVPVESDGMDSAVEPTELERAVWGRQSLARRGPRP